MRVKIFLRCSLIKFFEGNAATALQHLLDIAISHKMANDFFGNPHAAIGKTIDMKTERFKNTSSI